MTHKSGSLVGNIYLQVFLRYIYSMSGVLYARADLTKEQQIVLVARWATPSLCHFPLLQIHPHQYLGFLVHPVTLLAVVSEVVTKQLLLEMFHVNIATLSL